MREVRIFVDDPGLGPGPFALTDQAAKHVAQVLRMKAGQSLTIFDGAGHEYPATIECSSKNRVDIQINGREYVDRESPLHLVLALAMARGERMDFVAIVTPNHVHHGPAKMALDAVHGGRIHLVPERFGKICGIVGNVADSLDQFTL